MYYKIYLTKDLQVKEEWVNDVKRRGDELFTGYIGEPHFSFTAAPEKQVWGKVYYEGEEVRKVEWSGRDNRYRCLACDKQFRARTEKEYFEEARAFLLEKAEEIKKAWEEVYAEQEKAEKDSPFVQAEKEEAFRKLEAIREAIAGNKETVSVHKIRRILEG